MEQYTKDPGVLAMQMVRVSLLTSVVTPMMEIGSVTKQMVVVFINVVKQVVLTLAHGKTIYSAVMAMNLGLMAVVTMVNS